jgi:hypothetical protein
LEFRLEEFVTIQIHEPDVAIHKLLTDPSLVEKQIRVAMMPWAFADGYGSGIETKEGFGCGAYKSGIGVHQSSGDVFDDVGFKQDRLAQDVQIEESKALVDQLVEFVRVLVRVEDRDT